MDVKLSLKKYKKADGTDGQSLILTTPKGVKMEITHRWGNCKLVYKVECEVAEHDKEQDGGTKKCK